MHTCERREDPWSVASAHYEAGCDLPRSRPGSWTMAFRRCSSSTRCSKFGQCLHRRSSDTRRAHVGRAPPGRAAVCRARVAAMEWRQASWPELEGEAAAEATRLKPSESSEASKRTLQTSRVRGIPFCRTLLLPDTEPHSKPLKLSVAQNKPELKATRAGLPFAKTGIVALEPGSCTLHRLSATVPTKPRCAQHLGRT